MTGAMATRSPAADIRSCLRITPTSLLLAGFFRIVGFFQPRASQDVAQGVVAFVARVFVHELVGRRPRVLAPPRFRSGLGVVYREPVEERLRIHATESLDDVQVRRGPAEAGFL